LGHRHANEALAGYKTMVGRSATELKSDGNGVTLSLLITVVLAQNFGLLA
jgi:hypothetical protein